MTGVREKLAALIYSRYGYLADHVGLVLVFFFPLRSAAENHLTSLDSASNTPTGFEFSAHTEIVRPARAGGCSLDHTGSLQFCSLHARVKQQGLCLDSKN